MAIATYVCCPVRGHEHVVSVLRIFISRSCCTAEDPLGPLVQIIIQRELHNFYPFPSGI